MKKIVLAGFFFTCFAVVGVQAQKNQSKGLRDSVATTNGGASSNREARPIGKGSPLVQRQGASTGDSKQSEQAAPVAPATTEKKSQKETTATKPKAGNAPKQ